MWLGRHKAMFAERLDGAVESEEEAEERAGMRHEAWGPHLLSCFHKTNKITLYWAQS